MSEHRVPNLNWLWQDLRFGLRTLRKDFRFASLAILALALGIGATTVIFSAIDAILLEPYPYKDADRLTHFFIHDVTRPLEDGRGAFSVPEFMDFREQNNVFEDMIGYGAMDVLYSQGAGAEQFDGCWVTGNTFEFSGVLPLLGRWITPEDAKPDSPPVFVMSYPLWIKRFNQRSEDRGDYVHSEWHADDAYWDHAPSISYRQPRHLDAH